MIFHLAFSSLRALAQHERGSRTDNIAPVVARTGLDLEFDHASPDGWGSFRFPATVFFVFSGISASLKRHPHPVWLLAPLKQTSVEFSKRIDNAMFRDPEGRYSVDKTKWVSDTLKDHDTAEVRQNFISAVHGGRSANVGSLVAVKTLYSFLVQ